MKRGPSRTSGACAPAPYMARNPFARVRIGSDEKTEPRRGESRVTNRGGGYRCRATRGIHEWHPCHARPTTLYNAQLHSKLQGKLFTPRREMQTQGCNSIHVRKQKNTARYRSVPHLMNWKTPLHLQKRHSFSEGNLRKGRIKHST